MGVLFDQALPPLGETFAGADPCLAMGPRHRLRITQQQDPFLGPELVGTVSQKSFSQDLNHRPTYSESR